jgi:hypothetical protein
MHIVQMRDDSHEMPAGLVGEFRQNDDLLQCVKASESYNAKRLERCVEILGLVNARSRASRVALEDLSDDIRAQREGLLAVIDELRRRNGPAGSH